MVVLKMVLLRIIVTAKVNKSKSCQLTLTLLLLCHHSNLACIHHGQTTVNLVVAVHVLHTTHAQLKLKK